MNCTRGARGSTGAGVFTATFPNVNTSGYESLNLTKDGFMTFKKVEGLSSMQRRTIKTMERKLKRVGVLLSDEVITGMVEEGFADDILQVLVDLQSEKSAFNDVTVEVHSRTIYDEILEATTSAILIGSYGMESKTIVNTKYKTVAKKVKPVTTQLSPDTNDHIQQAGKEPRVREARNIGYNFTKETMAKLKIERDEFLNEQKKKMFQDMLSKHDKAFASSPDEIGCTT